MSDGPVPYTYCYVCRKQMTTMKRCTRCRGVIYCSRTCQVEDWPRHKSRCGKDVIPADPITRSIFTKNDNSIFVDEHKEQDVSVTVKSRSLTSSQNSHPPLVDFNKALKKSTTDNPTHENMLLQDSTADNQTTKDSSDSKTYLCVDKFYCDLPTLDETAPYSELVIKCNKEKHKMSIQNSWTGNEIFKYLSYTLTVPLDKLKLIHKGKVLTKDTIVETIKNKAIYIAFGEKAESEDGVDQRDITVMMQQMGVDRNKAIQTLKQKGDLIDALLS